MQTALQSSTPSPAPSSTLVEQIARSTGSPIAVVQAIYERELQALSSGAKITQFVGVIATRRVLMELRER